MNEAGNELSLVFIELGLAVIGLALLARLASRWGFSAIPLYLLAGLSFGNGGLLPLNFSEEFIHLGAEIGVLLLLFMLGLEYSGTELKENLQRGLPAGAVDFLLNFPPGLICGFLLGWDPLASILLGGVTYISSSGVIAKVLSELGRMNKPETPIILSILVIEDLAMAVYLPLVAVLLIGQGWVSGLVSILIALITVSAVLFVAIRYGTHISGFISHESNEIILLTTFGMILLVAGVAQRLQVSSAVGAFLVGIALSGSLAQRAHHLISPLRDLFAATFFFFFGLQIDPSTLPPVMLVAVALGLVTTLTKLLTGWWATRRAGIDRGGQLLAGTVLAARGEFSVVIAGLGVSAGLNSQIGSLATAYILFLVVLSPILARVISDKSKVSTFDAAPKSDDHGL